MILKYSFLNTEETLVKYLKNKKYGIYNLKDEKVILEAEFDYLCFQDNLLIGEKSERFFKIDPSFSMSELKDFEPGFFFYKFDRCPNCSGLGCRSCDGLGIIRIPSLEDPID